MLVQTRVKCRSRRSRYESTIGLERVFSDRKRSDGDEGKSHGFMGKLKHALKG